MFSTTTLFSYDNLKKAISMNLSIDKNQLSVALKNINSLDEVRLLIQECGSQKITMQFADYLLSNATNPLMSENEKLRYSLSLITFIQSTSKTEDTWQAFSDQKEYQFLISDLLTYRSLKDPINEKTLHVILNEGIRCKNRIAFENVIRYLYANKHGYDGGPTAARAICYKFVLSAPVDVKDKLTADMYPILIALSKQKNNEQRNKEINFVNCLLKLGESKYYLLTENPNNQIAIFNSIIDHYGLPLVSEIVEQLSYKPLIYLLAMYHAEQATNNFNSKKPNQIIYRNHIDTAEKYFNDLKNKGFLDKFIDQYRNNNKLYGDVLFALSCSRHIIKSNKAGYLLKGAEYNHTDCLSGLIADYIEKGNIEEAVQNFDQHVREMKWDELIKLTSKIMQFPMVSSSKVLQENANRIRKLILLNRDKDKDILPDLSFERITKLQGKQEMIWNNQPITATSNQTVFMIVLKEGLNVNKNEETTKCDNDPYKLYISFDPSKSENFIKCWALLMEQVLCEKNIYAVKLFHPVDAAKYFDKNGKSVDKAQPGKMAVIYFKSFSDIKKLHDKKYSLDDFYRENFMLIKKFEKLCHEYSLLPGNPQAIPEGGIRAKSENNTASFIFISAKEQDENGNYILSENRIPNTDESNPYTNKRILDWEHEMLTQERQRLKLYDK